MKLDVYDAANTTLQGTLSQASGVRFLDDLLVPGSASFRVDLASTADMALLEPRRVVRFRTGATPGTGDVAAFVIEDLPASSELEVSGVSTVEVRCAGLLSWLGYRNGGAVLYPYGGLGGRQQNPRLFGWMTADFDDSGWGPVGSSMTGGPLSTAGWPDERAVAFQTIFPGERSLYRRSLPALAQPETAARMYLAATWNTSVTIWLDGEVVLEKPAGKPGLWTADVPYDDLDHQLAVEVDGGTGRWGWTWVRLDLSTDEDGNEEWTPGTVLRRTFDPAEFPSADTPWLSFEGDQDYPGVTVGFVMDTALTEDGARHSRPWSWSFDKDDDSDAAAWAKTFTRGFRVQECGLLLDELTAIEGEPEMTPAGVFRFVKSRGTDKTASVTVSSPFALQLTGRGPSATRWLYETEGGFGQAVNASAETEWGTVMERFVQLGTDIRPDAVADAVAAELVREGMLRDEVQVDLPDDVEPYTDVVLGDTVTCVGRDGNATVRLTSFTCQVDDANGFVNWTATALPTGS